MKGPQTSESHRTLKGKEQSNINSRKSQVSKENIGNRKLRFKKNQENSNKNNI